MFIKRTVSRGLAASLSGSLALSTALAITSAASPAFSAEPAAAAPAADGCKDPKDCLNKGAIAMQAKDFAKAAKFLPSGCQIEPKACNIAGELYRKGEGVTADGAKAADFHKKACNAGIIISCAIEAQLRYTGFAGPPHGAPPSSPPHSISWSASRSRRPNWTPAGLTRTPAAVR